MGPQSRLVGVAVFGAGLLAVVAVVFLALSQRGGGPVNGPKALQQKESLNVPMVQAREAQTAPAPKTYTRQKNIDEDDIEGVWQAKLGNNEAVVQIKNGVYQIIVATPSPTAPRLYSNGTYKILRDLILFQPQLNWSKPAVPKGSNIEYQSLTMSPFPMAVSRDGRAMVWQNPRQDEKDIYVPRQNPMLYNIPDQVAIWTPLK